MAEGMTRRGALAALLALGTAGCGFRPMYGETGVASDPGTLAELRATRVGFIPERFGQLMRRALAQNLAQGGTPESPARYELMVSPGLTAEAIGIQRDGVATRLRYIATANWSLQRLPGNAVVANGFERSMDAINLDPNQAFAVDASREAAERRLARQLADDVVTRLAMRLAELRQGGDPRLIAPVTPPPVMPEIQRPLTPGGALIQGTPGLEGGLGGGIGPQDGFR